MVEEIRLVPLGDGIAGGDVVNVLVTEGARVTKNTTLLELETDKALIEVPSLVEGVITRVHVRKGDKVKVGQILFEFEATSPSPVAFIPKNPEKVLAPEQKSQTLPPEKPVGLAPAAMKTETGLSNMPAGPATRKLARELGVDLSLIPGTGRGGRITLDDVKAYANRLLNSHIIPSKRELPDFSRWGSVERRELSSLRGKIAANMGNAWSTVPLVTQFDEANIAELEEMRKKNSEYIKQMGGKLTITIFVLKAVTAALKAYPQFNASVDLERGEIIYKKYYNIGVAVDTPTGLIVPVIKNVDQKSILELAKELVSLSERARNRKISIDELQGGNISISNLGGIGGTAFTPLVLPPDVAVVGFSRSAVRPVWLGERFEPRLILPFSVSYDHRVIDGADGARFARFIATELENYQHLLMEG